MVNEYAALSKLVREAGLFKYQQTYYSLRMLLNFFLFSISIAIFFLTDSFWIHMLNAVYFALIYLQVGSIIHDAGHLAVFKTERNNDIAGLFHGGFTGLSYSWWALKHQQHHSNLNEDEMDPDVNFPVVAFSDNQARRKGKTMQSLVKQQHILFPVYLALTSFNMRFHSARVLLTEKGVKYRLLEIFLMIFGITAYFTLIFSQLSLPVGLLWLAVNLTVTGLYVGSVFAPNHKGMPILDKNHKMDFFHQTLYTTRDVKGGRIADFMYGCLNYQIEHHLFPSMPRNNLSKVQPIVKKFCAQRQIHYHETDVIGSWKEIFKMLYRVSRFEARRA